MNILRIAAEAIANLTVIVVGITVMGFIVYYMRQHVTCVDLINWCVIH